MKLKIKKLELSKESLKILSTRELGQIGGGLGESGDPDLCGDTAGSGNTLCPF